ncbi:MAG TPA: membrane protein insertase YidC [Bacteroidales bacterium]|nr:membrane protein insertase YidC [Bacteroidales bacterium]
MNRNTIIGLILIFAIFIGWSYLMQPSEEEIEQQRQEQIAKERERRTFDSIREIRKAEQQEALARQQEAQAPLQVNTSDTAALYQQLSSQYGSFGMSGMGEEEFITVENDVMKLLFSSRGGRIFAVELKKYKTWDSVPLILFDADTARFGFNFYSHGKALNTSNMYFTAESADGLALNSNYVKVSGNDSVKLVLKLYADGDAGSLSNDKFFAFTYTVYGGEYMLDYDVNLHGLESEITTSLPYTLELDWSTFLRKQEKTQDRLSGTTIYYRSKDNEVDYLSETDADEKDFVDKLGWVSMKQRFFSSTLLYKNGYFENPKLAHTTSETPQSDRYLKTMMATLDVPVDGFDNSTAEFRFYFGPNDYNILRSYKLDLERQIPLGWSFFLLQWINRYAVIPVFTWLGSYGWNYGIVILVLTIMLKIVLFPIAYRTYRSTAKMRVLKPEVDEINKKYPKKEDAMKKQQATMALYRSVGVNPMAGCVPMLLQFPILIAMFRFFPASIELRQKSFLWAEDLSSYDSIAQLPFEIPFYGDHVSLFTLLMTVSTIIYTWMNNQMMSSSQQMPGMKTMMYLMPLMFLGWFNNYASGLSYYYLLANLITFGQMFVIRETINEEKIYKKLQENKKKPKKQSGFQKRLEDAARKRQNPPKKK